MCRIASFVPVLSENEASRQKKKSLSGVDLMFILLAAQNGISASLQFDLKVRTNDNY